MSKLLKGAILRRKRLEILKQRARRRDSCLPPSRPAAKSSVSNTKTTVESSVPATTGTPQRAESGDLQQLRAQHKLKSMAADTSWKIWEGKRRRIQDSKSRRTSKGAEADNERYKQVWKTLRLIENPLEGWRTLQDYRKWGTQNSCVAYRLSRPRPTPRLQYGELGARMNEQEAKKRVEEKFEALVTQAYWFNEVLDGDVSALPPTAFELHTDTRQEWDFPAQLDEIIKQAAFRQKVA